MSSLSEMAPPADAPVVVVGARIWLTGLMFGGVAEELLKTGISRRQRLLTTERSVQELTVVLRDRLGFSEPALDQVRQFVNDCAEIVDDPVSCGCGYEYGDVASGRLAEVAEKPGADTFSTARSAVQDEPRGVPVLLT